ncbi:DUF4412 domain-containing protein [Lacinutrix neustonica]|uniref:DUF4412 domain-containing protein n=1 Tax=Lacinutrix neustonica TaxID=2980107 RepID=A0A9E8SCV8_9FLAO|nr:DUF4412 domain-containing protein [Lacinutrix neustonica]WAC01758.1 DUF4412 domain-containing protein [Lacinutrix neustonica]
MKKILILVAFAIGFAVNAQDKLNEGVLVSKQTITSKNEQVQAQLAMMGDMVSETYFKGSKSRAEMSNPMTGDITTISDGDSKEVRVLMDNPQAGKMYNTKSINDAELASKEIIVTKGEESKTILDYNCQQYFVTIKDGDNEMNIELFVTDKIQAFSADSSLYKDKIEGFPLYSSMDINQNGMDMTVTSQVTAIRKEGVSDDKFVMVPPSGYTKIEGQ